MKYAILILAFLGCGGPTIGSPVDGEWSVSIESDALSCVGHMGISSTPYGYADTWNLAGRFACGALAGDFIGSLSPQSLVNFGFHDVMPDASGLLGGDIIQARGVHDTTLSLAAKRR